MSSKEEQNLAVAKRYLELVGSPITKPEDLRTVLDESIVWREMPNMFAPAGRVSDHAAMLAGFGKGRQYLPNQTYVVRHTVACEDTVALEISWSGEVAKPIGPFPAGARLSAQVAVFLRFQGGRIVSQTDYPCYEPVGDGAA
jgi:ketosteroid isomerase-like protein